MTDLLVFGTLDPVRDLCRLVNSSDPLYISIQYDIIHAVLRRRDILAVRDETFWFVD